MGGYDNNPSGAFEPLACGVQLVVSLRPGHVAERKKVAFAMAYHSSGLAQGKSNTPTKATARSAVEEMFRLTGFLLRMRPGIKALASSSGHIGRDTASWNIQIHAFSGLGTLLGS